MRVATVANKNFRIKNMRIDRIASGAEYRMDKQFQNLLILGILIVFSIVKL